MGYGDYNGDGHFGVADVDRWQLDNGGYPGQLENAGTGACGGGGGTGGGCLTFLTGFLLVESGCAIAIGIAICVLIVFIGIAAMFS